MTVEQLIAELKKCDPSAGLYWHDPLMGEFTAVQTVEDFGGRVWLSWRPPVVDTTKEDR